MKKSLSGLKILALTLGANTFLALPLFAATATPGSTSQLQTETVSAWDEYVRNADLRMKARIGTVLALPSRLGR